MNWNVAQAKQRFSEVLRAAQDAPQLICNRDTPVAALIAAEEFAAYETWKRSCAAQSSLADEMAELRRLLLAEGVTDGLELPPRTTRPNAFTAMLEQDYPELPPATDMPPR